METGECEDDVGSEERRRRRRNKCVKTVVTALFSHVGLAAILVGYTIMGGFLFQALEAPAEDREKVRIKQFKMDKVEELAQQAMQLRVHKIDRDNFTAAALNVLHQFQQQVTLAVKENGWDGNDDTEEAPQQWSFAGALLYAVTVITTIGYGHVAPKTKWGRMITIVYALVGIPLMFLYLSNMGNFMAESFRIFYQKVCCGLCIYRRQFGLCCGNDGQDEDVAASHHGGRRKTRIVLAAQYNRAFDESAAAAGQTGKGPVSAADRPPPSSTKENGAVAVESSSSTTDQQTGEVSTSEHHREVDETAAHAGTDGEALEDVAAAVVPAESHSPNTADDTADVSRVQASDPDDGVGDSVEPPTNDRSDNGDNAVSDSSSVTASPSDDCVHAAAASPSDGNGNSSLAVEPDLESRDPTAPDGSAAVTDDRSTDRIHGPEVALPETEDYFGTTTAPAVHRRWRSMGAGSRLRRTVDVPACDKAVEVHEEDLVAQPEPEIITHNEVSEEHRAEGGETAEEQSGGEKADGTMQSDLALADPRMLGELVLDLDELGVLNSSDDKHEEMRVTVPISICLIVIAAYISAGSMLFTVWEDWDYLTGCYFCFVTLSTIGFGDIVPGTGMKEMASGEKLVICVLWLALGLSMLAMCFNLMQEEVKDKFEWCGRKVGLLKKDEEND